VKVNQRDQQTVSRVYDLERRKGETLGMTVGLGTFSLQKK
jgi:hypothetical protein